MCVLASLSCRSAPSNSLIFHLSQVVYEDARMLKVRSIAYDTSPSPSLTYNLLQNVFDGAFRSRIGLLVGPQ